MLDLEVNVARNDHSFPKQCYYSLFFKWSVLCPFITTCHPFIHHSTCSWYTSYHTWCSVFVIIIFLVLFSEWNQESSRTFWKGSEKNTAGDSLGWYFTLVEHVLVPLSVPKSQWKVKLHKRLTNLEINLSFIAQSFPHNDVVVNLSSEPMDTNMFHQSEVPL